MEIKQRSSGHRGRFIAKVDGENAGLMTYSIVGPKKIIIDHTEVVSALQGNDVGYALVTAAVDYARANDIKIVPMCPFAKAVLTKNQTFSDVLT